MGHLEPGGSIPNELHSQESTVNSQDLNELVEVEVGWLVDVVEAAMDTGEWPTILMTSNISILTVATGYWLHRSPSSSVLNPHSSFLKIKTRL